MSHIRNVNFQFGQATATVDTVEPQVAPRGFTANSIKFPIEGQLIEKDFEVVDGFTAPHDIDIPQLTLQRLEVHPDSAKKLYLSIRPTDAFLYKEKIGGGVLQPSENTNASSDQLQLGNVKIGDDDLTIQGRISADVTTTDGVTTTHYGYTTGSTVALTGTIANITDTTPATPATVMVSANDYGYWPVIVQIPPCGTDYEPFVLLAGTDAPDDSTFEDPSTGKLVKLSDMKDVVDPNRKLVKDFVVNPSNYSIVKSIDATGVKFPSGSTTMENLLVKVGEYVVGGGGVDLSSMSACYKHGRNPRYYIILPRGTVSENSFTLDEGSYLPPGHVVPAGSSITDAVGNTDVIRETNRLQLGRVRAEPGFILQGGYDVSGTITGGTELKGFVPLAERVRVPAGLSSSHFQLLNIGMRTHGDLNLGDINFQPGSSLNSKLTLKSDTRLDAEINLAKKSLLKRGSLLKKGSTSLQGALVDGDVNINAGSVVNDKFEIVGPHQVKASADSPVTSFEQGAVLKAPFTLPIGFYITSGNTLPAPVKILNSMGVTFKAGQVLEKDTHFSGAAQLSGDLGFEPKGVIPAQSVLEGTVTLPIGTEIEEGSNFTVPVQVPAGHSFAAGSVLPVGVSFREGAKLPKFDPSTQAGPVYDAATNSNPSTFAKFENSGENYLVIKGGSTLVSGFVIPVGSILSKAVSGRTTGIGTNANQTGTTSGTLSGDMTFNEGEYSADAFGNSPAANDVTLTAGSATTGVIRLLTSATLTSDLVIKMSSFDSSWIQHMRAGERFTLINDLELENPYQVEGSNTVQWAPNRPTPAKFVMSSPFSFTALHQTLNKPIKLNVRTTADYVNGILAPTASLKLPSGHILSHKIKLAVDQDVAVSGTYPLKSALELPAGTKLMTSGAVRLGTPVQVKQDFTVAVEIDNYPAFTLQNGMILLKGHKLAGDLSVRGGQGLPKGVTLSSDVVLTADHIVREDSHNLVKDSILRAGSELAVESSFPSGIEFNGGVTVGPILSLSNNFAVHDDDSELDTDLTFPYTLNNNNQVALPRYDARGLKLKVVQLVQQVEELLARQ